MTLNLDIPHMQSGAEPAYFRVLQGAIERMCSECGSGMHQLLNASNYCFVFKKTLFCLFICECLCMYLYVCLRAQVMVMMWISLGSLQDLNFSSHCVGSSNQTQVILLSAFTPTTNYLLAPAFIHYLIRLQLLEMESRKKTGVVVCAFSPSTWEAVMSLSLSCQLPNNNTEAFFY